MAVATPAIREAHRVKAMIPLFWANTFTGGEVAQLARKQLKPVHQCQQLQTPAVIDRGGASTRLCLQSWAISTCCTGHALM